MQCVEGIGSSVRTEATGYFLFDLEFAYSPLGAVVVRRYCRVFKEVEDVVPTFYYSPFQLVELFSQIVEILFEQVIKPDEPTLFRDYLCRFLVPQMDCLTQKFLYFLCPCLFLVNVVQIFKIA